MDQHCDHQPAERLPRVGVAPLRPFDQPAFEQAVTDLLRACGFEPAGIRIWARPRSGSALYGATACWTVTPPIRARCWVAASRTAPARW